MTYPDHLSKVLTDIINPPTLGDHSGWQTGRPYRQFRDALDEYHEAEKHRVRTLKSLESRKAVYWLSRSNDALNRLCWAVADDIHGHLELDLEFHASRERFWFTVHCPGKGAETVCSWHGGIIELVDGLGGSPEREVCYEVACDPFEHMPELARRVLQITHSRTDIVQEVARAFDLPQHGIDELYSGSGVTA